MKQNLLQEYSSFIRDTLFEAGKIILQYYRMPIKIESKQDDSPVTIADKEAETKIRNCILKYFPEHGILGEEHGSFQDNKPWTWVIDPIDGTKSFISGVPLFGSLMALLYHGKPVLGAFFQPVLNEFLIADGKTCLLNENPVQMRNVSSLSEATLLTTDHVNIGKYQKKDGFEKLIEEVKLYRTWGDCFGYYLLATGFADIMIDPEMKLWDKAALIPIIEGSGGIISDYQGKDAMEGNSIVAAHPNLHSQVIEKLNL